MVCPNLIRVDDTIASKIKALIFIPIVSQTYCDIKGFAWNNEFLLFNKAASNDQFGREILLPNGNVASRILPVRIHEIDREDVGLLENVLQGVLRSIDFIYHAQGVNRPLRPKDDDLHDNLNNTIYRNQINKVANAIKEIITGIKSIKSKEEGKPQLSFRHNLLGKIIFPAGITQLSQAIFVLQYILSSSLQYFLHGPAMT